MLKLVVHRLISTSSCPSVERTIPQIKDVISRDYTSVIKRRLDDVYKNVNPIPTGPQREKADKDNKSTFIVSISVPLLAHIFML